VLNEDIRRQLMLQTIISDMYVYRRYMYNQSFLLAVSTSCDCESTTLMCVVEVFAD